MNKFLTAVFAATLFSSAALADWDGKTITFVCSDDVLSGTVVLSNPPKVNCKDFELVKALVGTDITIGPDANVDRIARAVRRATRKGQSLPDRLVKRWPWPVGKHFEKFEPVTGDRRLDGVWQPLTGVNDDINSEQPRQKRDAWQSIDGVDDDINPEFTKKFPGITRNREFFISGTSSCRGWVPVQDIVNGKCLNGKVKVD